MLKELAKEEKSPHNGQKKMRKERVKEGGAGGVAKMKGWGAWPKARAKPCRRNNRFAYRFHFYTSPIYLTLKNSITEGIRESAGEATFVTLVSSIKSIINKETRFTTSSEALPVPELYKSNSIAKYKLHLSH